MDIHAIDPISHVDGGAYVAWWQYMFAHLLQGFWARFIAVGFLFLSFYFGLRRRNMQAFAIFFVCALIITFIAPLLKISGLI